MRISDWSSDVCSSDVPLNVPPIVGLGSTGGFEYALQALQGQPAADIAATVRGMSLAANQDPALAGVFSPFAAPTPKPSLAISSETPHTLGVALDDIVTPLQATPGGSYVDHLD